MLKTKIATGGVAFYLAESEGFEPPDPCRSTVFKTAAIDHSANSPRQKYTFFVFCKAFKFFLSKISVHTPLKPLTEFVLPNTF